MKKIILISLSLIPASLIADFTLDNGIKKECQYHLYGNGVRNDIYSGYVAGIIDGILYTTYEKYQTSFAKHAKTGTIVNKACQNALLNISADGFLNDYKWEVSKLVDTRFEKLPK